MLQKSVDYIKDAHNSANRLAVFKDGELIASNIYTCSQAKITAETEAVKRRGVRQYFQVCRYKNGESPIASYKSNLGDV